MDTLMRMDFLDTRFIILFTLMAPLAAAFLSAVIRTPNIREGCTILVGAIVFTNVVNLLRLAPEHGLPKITLLEVIPGIDLTLHIDPLGMLFALVASFLWIVTTIYSIGYMRGNNEAHQNRFYAFFAIAIFAAMGIAFAGNLFTLFLFYEVLTLCTYPLVTHSQTTEAKRSGRVYLGILLTTSIAFQLTAIIITWYTAGTVEFAQSGILGDKLTPLATGLLLLLYVYGIGKAAVMPLHRWLPAAMVAPTPVSALLHAVAVVKAGLFTLIKVIVYVFGVDHLHDLMQQHWWSVGWLPWLGTITILLASVVALRQDNLKLRLAYSTISQLSYVVLAVGLFNKAGIIAACFHVAAHAFAKITLFFAAGSIYTASGKKYISELSGIGKRMPWTMAAFAIGTLSMIGLPPTAGLITKFFLLEGAHQHSEYFVGVLALSTLLNAAYFLPIIFRAYFAPEAKKPKKAHGEAPAPILVALAITSFLTVATFVYPDVFIWLGRIMAEI